MRVFAALLIFCLIGVDVQALSCAQPNVARDFNWRQDDQATYRIFVGQVRMVGPIPKYREGQARTAKAMATGWFLGKTSLTDQRSFALTVNAVCAASWCSGFPDGTEPDSIMFFEKTPKGDVLNIGPCDYGFEQPALKKQIKVLQRCLKRGKCSDTDVEQLDQF